jgi:hypothetical protein
VRPAPRACARDDVGAPVAVDVAGGDVHAAGEIGGMRTKLVISLRSVPLNTRTRNAAESRTCDDVEHVVAVDVSERDVHAADKRGVAREEQTVAAGGIDGSTSGPLPGPVPMTS